MTVFEAALKGCLGFCTSREQDKVEESHCRHKENERRQRKGRKGEVKDSENNGNISWGQSNKDLERLN